MGRYKFTDIVRDQNGHERYRTNYDFKYDENDVYVIYNTKGDRLRLEVLARQYYGDPTLWWIIAKVNDIKFPFNVNNFEIIIPKNIASLKHQTK